MAGLLDWMQTPQGIGLLSGVASYAANARRGTPVNNIGRGLAGAVEGYNAYFANQEAQAYKKAMADAAIANAATARSRAEIENRKLEAKARSEKQARDEAVGFLKTYGYDVTPDSIQIDDEYGYSLTPGSIQGGFVQIADTTPEETPLLGNPFEQPKQPSAPQTQLINPNYKPEFNILNDQQNQAYKRGQLQRSLGLNDDEFSVFNTMPAEKQAGFILKQFGTRKTSAPKMSFEDAMILRSEGVNVPGYEGYTPEIASKWIGKKNIGRKAAAPSATASVGNVYAEKSAMEAAKTRGREFGQFTVEATKNAQSAYDAANDIAMVTEGLRGMGGGPVAEFKAWAGQYFPAESDWGKMASMNDLAKTVQTKLAPTMRVAGSGATSDFEMKAYMRAIPTLTNTEKGRELMSKYASRMAERAQIRAEIVNDIEAEGRLPTPREIDQKMAARVGNGFFDAQDRAFFNMKQPAQTTAPAGQPKSGVKFLGFE